MRAFDTDEIKEFTSQTDFILLDSEEWMTGHLPSNETWGVYNFAERTN